VSLCGVCVGVYKILELNESINLKSFHLINLSN
jgi:hypothetical protein